jgi:hypothetical protein
MTPGSFERMGEPRTMVRSRLETGLWLPSTQFVLKPLSAGVYDCGVGPGTNAMDSGSTAPTMSLSSGALRQSRRSSAPIAPAALL